ncbi:MAG: hypothetical protein HW405_501 [Candidatus Berkelbacteria bacterium]|nr:hypothetical protein [Candidatus Berkelbacteria bacterium]
MKKVWIILLLGVIVGAGLVLWFLIKPIYNQKVFEVIRYGNGQYRLGLTPAMNLQELKQNNFGDVVSSGVFYHGREIYIKGGVEFPYGGGHAVIFLKQKDADLFDIYSLMGGP